MKYKKNKKILALSIFIALAIIIVFFLAIKIASYFFITNKQVKIVSSKTPVNLSLFFNNNGQNDFSKKIVQEIDKSSVSLEIAVYSIKSIEIRDAILRAYLRGVKIVIITDFRKQAIHDEFFKDLPAGIKRLNLGSNVPPKTFLMHHKFALIDRNTKQERLIFGSNNWTELQDQYDKGFMVITDNYDLISGFGREFDRLNKGLSGPDKFKDNFYNSYDLNLLDDKNQYQIFFGPSKNETGLSLAIKNMILNAKSSIKIMTWDFTDKNIADLLIKRAKQGISIEVIGDSFNVSNSKSVFNYLSSQNLENLEVLTDSSVLKNATSSESIDPFMHYHVIITDDSKVMFGSNNLSYAGSYLNDESVIITNDSSLTSSFFKVFKTNWNNGKKLDK
jgi:phosphatidylserine/phosphatidylglycerophosphate/cardiolipin synthase-like enzyme